MLIVPIVSLIHFSRNALNKIKNVIVGTAAVNTAIEAGRNIGQFADMAKDKINEVLESKDSESKDSDSKESDSGKGNDSNNGKSGDGNSNSNDNGNSNSTAYATNKIIALFNPLPSTSNPVLPAPLKGKRAVTGRKKIGKPYPSSSHIPSSTLTRLKPGHKQNCFTSKS